MRSNHSRTARRSPHRRRASYSWSQPRARGSPRRRPVAAIWKPPPSRHVLCAAPTVTILPDPGSTPPKLYTRPPARHRPTGARRGARRGTRRAGPAGGPDRRGFGGSDAGDVELGGGGPGAAVDLGELAEPDVTGRTGREARRLLGGRVHPGAGLRGRAPRRPVQRRVNLVRSDVAVHAALAGQVVQARHRVR